MSDYRATEPSRASGRRTGMVAILLLMGFVAGLALMGYCVHRGWLKLAPSTVQVRAGAGAGTAPDGFSPQLPLNANGDTPQRPGDPAVLAVRESTLAAQIAALEARSAAISIDASNAGSQATRAEGLLVAFAARRALDRGLGLGYLDEQLRLRFGQTQPQAVLTVIRAARQPLTLEDLRQGLDTIAPDITSVGGRDWFDTLKRQVSGLIVLREAATPSPLPGDRLARARRLLDGGQVEAARAEIVRMPGADAASNWTAAATRYIGARQALDTIEAAALTGQPRQPVPAPQTPPPIETIVPEATTPAAG